MILDNNSDDNIDNSIDNIKEAWATNLARERWGPTLLRIVAIIRVMTNWMPSTAIFAKLSFSSFLHSWSFLTCPQTFHSQIAFLGERLFKEEAVISSSFVNSFSPDNVPLSSTESQQPVHRQMGPVHFPSVAAQKQVAVAPLSAGIAACDFLS